MAADQIRLKLEDQQESESETDIAQPTQITSPPSVVQASAGLSESFPTSKSEDAPSRGRTLRTDHKKLPVKAAPMAQPASKRSSTLLEKKTGMIQSASKRSSTVIEQKTEIKPAITLDTARSEFDWADEMEELERQEALKREEASKAASKKHTAKFDPVAVVQSLTSSAQPRSFEPVSIIQSANQTPTPLEQLTLDIHSLQRLCELSQLSDDRLVDEVEYFYVKSQGKIRHKLASEPVFMSAEICEPGTFKASVKLKNRQDLTTLKFSGWANEFRADYTLRDSETYQVRVNGFIKRESDILPTRLAKARFLLDMSMREDWAYGIHDIVWHTYGLDEPPVLTLKFFDRDKANLALQRGVVWEETHFDCSVVTSNTLQCCYRCKRYGHESTSCKNPQVCPRCLWNHDRMQCDAKAPKCYTCNGAHITEDEICPVRRKFKREKRFPDFSEVMKAAKVAQRSKTSFRKDGGGGNHKKKGSARNPATSPKKAAFPPSAPAGPSKPPFSNATPNAKSSAAAAMNTNTFPPSITKHHNAPSNTYSVNGDGATMLTASSEADSSTWPSNTDATKEDWAGNGGEGEGDGEGEREEGEDFGYEYKLRFSDRKREKVDGEVNGS